MADIHAVVSVSNQLDDKVKRAWKPLQRKNDLMIMQFFINLKFNPTQLETLNRCRIFHQVITLSQHHFCRWNYNSSSDSPKRQPHRQKKHIILAVSAMATAVRLEPLVISNGALAA